ncbi:MAG: DUF108 domain-containing protein [Candidatus Omnitrophica bacterium]|nr:DUF108 domain-containing protein [Candidatus Omnitrophota bacterium]
MTRVGVVGCGTIGTVLAQTIEREYPRRATIVALCDQLPQHAAALQRRLSARPPILSLQQVVRRSDLIIEAATADAASRVARLALHTHRDVLIMSTGGLLADVEWRRVAQRSRGRLYVPSGGIGGLDGVKALATGPLRRVTLTTRKPPAGLMSAPFVQQRGISLRGLRRPRLLFQGSPREAVKAFPQNTNVAATLALACLLQAPSRRVAIAVRVVADPSLKRNVHEVEVIGEVGRVSCRIESRPSAANPKTSETAIRSAQVTLRQIFGSVRIGT